MGPERRAWNAAPHSGPRYPISSHRGHKGRGTRGAAFFCGQRSSSVCAAPWGGMRGGPSRLGSERATNQERWAGLGTSHGTGRRLSRPQRGWLHHWALAEGSRHSFKEAHSAYLFAVSIGLADGAAAAPEVPPARVGRSPHPGAAATRSWGCGEAHRPSFWWPVWHPAASAGGACDPSRL